LRYAHRLVDSVVTTETRRNWSGGNGSLEVWERGIQEEDTEGG